MMHGQQNFKKNTWYIYNRALYTYLNTHRYMHPQWKSLYPLCAWSGYGPWVQRRWNKRKNSEGKHFDSSCSH